MNAKESSEVPSTNNEAEKRIDEAPGSIDAAKSRNNATLNSNGTALNPIIFIDPAILSGGSGGSSRTFSCGSYRIPG
uniref:Uncharacterized protein n=1 Tax=Candidatus Kentrum eta TaxID=2126337 RepID=A0A450VTZ0_9GAMM|nr:MAG: hypothetical protein BECKH772B_GA0070898_108431 [Candidatus Kentron sp. H]VFK08268.1 MAG: hypothetical protein BECKH772A_GA0070896_108391 [Candidatus Kentron sp. H]VFK09873.1 MAG: hypothetical protein BECKH772C_GA0070978_106521 [Candidatus Kentron sp. H]